MADYEVIKRGPAYETVEASTGNVVRVWNAEGKIDRSKRVTKTAEISRDNIQTKPRTRKDFNYGIIAKGTQYYNTDLKVERKKPRRTNNIREKREKAMREYQEEQLMKSMKKLTIKKKKAASDSEEETDEEEEEKENIQNKKTESKKVETKKPAEKAKQEEKTKETEPSQEVAASKTQIRRRKSGVKKETKPGLDEKAVKILESHGFEVKEVESKRFYGGRSQPIPAAIQQFVDIAWNKKVLSSKKFNIENMEIVEFTLPEEEVQEAFPVLLTEKYADRFILIGDGQDALMAMQEDNSADFGIYVLEAGTDAVHGPIKVSDLLASATFSEKLEESTVTLNESQAQDQDE